MNAIRKTQAQLTANIRARYSPTLGIAIAVGAVTALAALLRILYVGQDSFWNDEILSVVRAQFGWSEFYAYMSDIPNMAFYYFLLRFWIYLGDTEAVVRGLSVIFGVATVPLVYLLGARLFNARVGLVGAFLMAVNAFHIQYSQEARSYGLLTFLAVLSSWFFIRAIERPSWGNWVGYVIAGALLIYSHELSSVVLFAHLTSLLFLPRKNVPWKALIVSFAGIVFLTLPSSLDIITGIVADSSSGSGSNLGGGLDWIEGTSLAGFHEFLINLTGNGGNLLLATYLVLVGVALAIAGRTWFSFGASVQTWKYAFLLSWLIVPILVILGVSIHTPLFVSRYLLICLPPMTLLAGVVITQIRIPRPVRVPVVFAAVLIALSVLSVRGTYAYYTDFEKEDWRGASNLILSQWQPGDATLFYMPWMEEKFEFYAQRSAGIDPQTLSAVPFTPWNSFITANNSPDRQEIAQFLPDEYERLWLVTAHTSQPDRNALHNEIKTALEDKYRSHDEWKFPNVRVAVYSEADSGVFGNEWSNGTAEPVQQEPVCMDLPVTIVGDNNNNAINGTEGDDVIDGMGGNDTINGGGGNDVICGGSGDDVLRGEDGDDILRGGSGDDLLNGGNGSDQLLGISGNDTLEGEEGDDVLHGGSGDDILRGGPGVDDLSGTAGDDQLFGDAGQDTLSGGTGNDLLDGGDDSDVLSGNDDNDELYGGGGDDILEGGKGDDNLDGGPGNDNCNGSGGGSRVGCE